ncbi:MAG: anthranilate phosphoribosyltransferase [Enterobacteriaceae bacterium]
MLTLLEKLYHGGRLNQKESQKLFSSIIRGEMDPVQLSAALISMKVREETPEEICGAAMALLEDAVPFPRPDYDFADIVGTGGDKSNSINISTASAFVAACCGAKIAKHCNRAVSSRSGSSDLLNAFGLRLDLSPEEARYTLDNLNICFLLASQYHSGFRYAIPVRQQLKTRTLFNVLGPLTNPARPPLALIGVYSPELAMPMASTLKMLGYRRAAIVHGGGMDEVAVHAPTQVVELNNGEIECYWLNTSDFGLKNYPVESLAGGSPLENRDILARLLQGKGEIAHATAVAVNVAMLLKVFGHEDLRSNAQQALDMIASGEPYERIMALAHVHQEAS